MLTQALPSVRTLRLGFILFTSSASFPFYRVSPPGLAAFRPRPCRWTYPYTHRLTSALLMDNQINQSIHHSIDHYQLALTRTPPEASEGTNERTPLSFRKVCVSEAGSGVDRCDGYARPSTSTPLKGRDGLSTRTVSRCSPSLFRSYAERNDHCLLEFFGKPKCSNMQQA